MKYLIILFFFVFIVCFVLFLFTSQRLLILERPSGCHHRFGILLVLVNAFHGEKRRRRREKLKKNDS
jgi:hypothetical protein